MDRGSFCGRAGSFGIENRDRERVGRRRVDVGHVGEYCTGHGTKKVPEFASGVDVERSSADKTGHFEKR